MTIEEMVLKKEGQIFPCIACVLSVFKIRHSPECRLNDRREEKTTCVDTNDKAYS